MNCTVLSFLPFIYMDGDIAQLARAAALQAVGQGFESPYLHTHDVVRGGLQRRLKKIGKGNARKRRLECLKEGSV